MSTAPPKMYGTADTTRISGKSGVEESEAYRGAFRKDYGRLIHAPAFRRLQNKTQLFPSTESDFFRNRLTHSIEVAQIAGGLAMAFNHKYKERTEVHVDVDLVQFAGSAHDLGHPPFGHNGETALDDLMRNYGGFEGNAQTLRILSRLEKKADISLGHPNADDIGRLGMDLCYRSLAAILKYDSLIPSTREESESLKKGYYKSEAELVKKVKQNVAPGWLGKFKTIECQIMDVADDIAYSTYDLEDTLKAGFLSPLQIMRSVESDEKLVETISSAVKRALQEDGYDPGDVVDANEISELINEISLMWDDRTATSHSLQAAFDMFSVDRQFVEDGYVRTEMSAWLIGVFMSAVDFELNDNCPPLSTCKLSLEMRRKVEILKRLNYSLTIRSSRLEVVHYRGYDLVRELFEALTTDKGHGLLPPDVKRLHAANDDITWQRRVVCDYIAGMTDRYAVEFHGRLYGGDSTIFKPF